MSRIGKSIATESQLVVSGSWREEVGGVTAHRDGVSFQGDDSVLEVDGDDGYTRLRITKCP